MICIIIIFNIMSKSFEQDDLDYDPKPYTKMLEIYFSNKKVLVEHQIGSYNQFVREIIPSIVSNNAHVMLDYNSDKINIKYLLEFTNLAVRPPTNEASGNYMTSEEALNNGVNWVASLTATVSQRQIVTNIETGEIIKNEIVLSDNNVLFGRIPVMKRSCTDAGTNNPNMEADDRDLGGYFIINGSEKVVLSLETVVPRKPLIIAKKEPKGMAYSVQIHSKSADTYIGNTQTFNIKLKSDGSLSLVIPQFKEVSIFVLMRALGLESDRAIVNAILDTNETSLFNHLRVCMSHDSTVIATKAEARQALIDNLKQTTYYINNHNKLQDINEGKKRAQQYELLMRILRNFILPHVTSGTGDQDDNMLLKAYYIGYMIRKLLNVHIKGMKAVDDRDSLINKRVETPGILLGQLFDQYFKKVLKDCKRTINTKTIDVTKVFDLIQQIKSNTIEMGLRQALSTGSFGNQNKKGLSQKLERANYIQSLSNLRRVVTQGIDSTMKIMEPRHLHVTHYGSYDPAETPEGGNTGLVKNLAIMSSITVNMVNQVKIIREFLKTNIVSLLKADSESVHKQFKIFLNGCWVGVTKDAITLKAKMREMRFNGNIEKKVGLAMNIDEREFHIHTDNGRYCRPYICVNGNTIAYNEKQLKGIQNWEEFMAKNPKVIEYLDKDEEMGMMLALYPSLVAHSLRIMDLPPITNQKRINEINRINRNDSNIYLRYTHMEIHPATIFGVVTSNIPFPDHNQSPRVIFQYSQSRHAMGNPMHNYRYRMDITNILYHAQLPLIVSRISKYTGTHKYPAGENIICAMASFMGYNMEDSQVANKNSVERGLFRAESLKKKQEESSKKNASSTQNSQFLKPDPSKVDGMGQWNYDKLNESGYVEEETAIQKGDVIIGVVNNKLPTLGKVGDVKSKPYHDSSVVYDEIIDGAVDKVVFGANADGYKFVKMRIRSEKVPVIGDKFSGRSGQKGTIGYLAHKADMPFTEFGIIPDKILNPNCIPKRMTIGHLWEMYICGLQAIKGRPGDATPFEQLNFDKIKKEMDVYGMSDYGDYVCYDGMSGCKITNKLFIGPIYYQRLKQMVGDKIYARAGATTTNQLTRQPPDGRVRGGGLRFGEMERDAILAHGATQFFREKSMYHSDMHMAHVCDICGVIVGKEFANNNGGKMSNDNKAYKCKTCSNYTQITKIVIPYAFKLFIDEQKACSIIPRIITPNSVHR